MRRRAFEALAQTAPWHVAPSCQTSDLAAKGGFALFCRAFAGRAAAKPKSHTKSGLGQIPKPDHEGSGESRADLRADIRNHAEALRRRSTKAFKEDASMSVGDYTLGQTGEQVERMVQGKFRLDWRSAPGHSVRTRFSIEDRPRDSDTMDAKTNQNPAGAEKRTRPYSEYAGLRFPTLERAEHYDYHQDRGFQALQERAFPIKVPGHRRLDPYLREYIHFLHKLDPARFTIDRIAERYRLRTRTVREVIQEFAVNRYLTSSGLTKLSEKQSTREKVILAKKEQAYSKWAGWDQLGDEDDPETDDEAIGEFRGWRSTSDWVRRQTVEVEAMSAFPMMEKREPMPKRVDVDLVVDSTRSHKIINWLDPTDKVVF